MARRLPDSGFLRRDPALQEITFPNGIRLSPDEKTLKVEGSDLQARLWKALPVNADVTLGPSRLRREATGMVEKHRGLSNSLTTDVTGHS